MTDDQFDHEDDGRPSVVDDAVAVLARFSGAATDEAVRALHSDADAFGLPVTDIAQDVVDVARAARRSRPEALARLLRSIGPREVH